MRIFLLYQLLLLFFAGLTFVSNGQTPLNYDRTGWLAKAEQLKPELNETIIAPTGIVEMTRDSLAFQNWKAVKVAGMDSLYNHSFKQIREIIVDFGDHYTGYFSFDISVRESTPDGPLRFKLKFGEVPAEVMTPFDPYDGGLSRAWLQDEVVTVMNVPATVTLSRRVSFRYLKIELLASSPYFDFNISNLQLKAVTSAGNFPEPLPASVNPLIREIDRVGLNTLKECMQTVYEDGPKRDQRLWIGDLYLEALANTYSFKNHNLTKRCLYLLAGLSGEEGYLIATVFEAPEPHPQVNQYLLDYALLYNVVLKDYLEATNDLATAKELWPVAKQQLDIIEEYILPDGLLDYEKANAEWWLFFDWKDGLNKQAALQGLAIFALKETYELAKMIGREGELKTTPRRIREMTAAARKQLFNKFAGLFESGEEKQISHASQIWMILGGVLNQKESQKTLRALINHKEAVYPGGPYLYHYFIQALVNSGMKEEAKKYLTEYWGGMVKKGADTFWEVYDPNNEFTSPYGFFPINSYCHAWSCTPVYFIRKYPEVFQ